MMKAPRLNCHKGMFLLLLLLQTAGGVMAQNNSQNNPQNKQQDKSQGKSQNKSQNKSQGKSQNGFNVCILPLITRSGDL